MRRGERGKDVNAMGWDEVGCDGERGCLKEEDEGCYWRAVEGREREGRRRKEKVETGRERERAKGSPSRYKKSFSARIQSAYMLWRMSLHSESDCVQYAHWRTLSWVRRDPLAPAVCVCVSSHSSPSLSLSHLSLSLSSLPSSLLSLFLILSYAYVHIYTHV